MLSYLVHLKNKYPSARVFGSETSIDVYSLEGEHLIALRKNGAGQWQDEGEKLGASDKFCLAPIPKDARVFKLYGEGHGAKSEEHLERSKLCQQFVRNGKVPSCKELEAEGYQFDEKGRMLHSAQKVIDVAKVK